MNNKSFDCHICSGRVDFITKSDREILWYPNIKVKIPNDFPIATCDKCGEMYLSLDECEQLSKIINK